MLRAERAGYRVGEVPILVEELRPARTAFVKRVPRTLLGLLRLRLIFWREGVRRRSGRADCSPPAPGE